MKNEEALKIINQYRGSIAKGTIGSSSLRKVSHLPCSKGKIKHAYLAVIEDSLKNSDSLFNKEELVSEYCLLNYFVEDVIAEKFAKEYENWRSKKRTFERNKKDEIFAKQYIAYTQMLKNGGLFEEINDYINELNKNA